MANFKKLLMVVPPNITFDNFVNPSKNTKSWIHENGKELGVIVTDVPLGAMTICTWLQSQFDIETRLLDFNVEIHKNWDHPHAQSFEPWFEETIAGLDFEPDLIGFSSLFVTGYTNLITLGKVCKKYFPLATRIVGGNLATTMYMELFEDGAGEVFDAFCFGEGELPLLELFEAKNVYEYLEKSPSWITASKSSGGYLFAHNFINELDDIPALDYELLDLSDYQLSPTIKAYTQINDKTNYITYMTSRGCPFLCTFCSAHTVHGRKMRYFSVERIEKELTALQKTYSANTLVLEDDHFLSDNKRAKTIIGIAKKLGMKCVFPNALALFGLKKDMLECLESAGVNQLTLAVESGSQRVLKELMKKPLKTEITERVANDCYEMGIYTDCNIIIGMPGENLDDINEAREFLKELPANWYRINVATPLAGSEMYETALDRGELVGNIKEAGYKACVIETDHFTPHQINELAYSLNLELNFVYNTDMQKGNYIRAAESFENVLNLKHDHAFALFYLSICYQEIDETDRATEMRKKAIQLFKTDEIWNFYYNKFNISIPGEDVEFFSRHLTTEKGIMFSTQSSGIGRQSVSA